MIKVCGMAQAAEIGEQLPPFLARVLNVDFPILQSSCISHSML